MMRKKNTEQNNWEKSKLKRTPRKRDVLKRSQRERERERERERQTERDRQTDRQTDRDNRLNCSLQSKKLKK